MNQPDSEFENELRTLRPAQPAPALEERIAQALALTPARGGVATSGKLPSSARRAQLWLGRLGWAGSGALAALAVVAWMQPRQELKSDTATSALAAQFAPADALELIDSSTELLDTEDEGVLFEEGSEPVRQMRYRSRERHAWRDAETGARVELEVPREDVRFMPVAMQ